MAQLIESPAIIQAAGAPPKIIEEFVGQANSGTSQVSIARMKSPEGWSEPGQTPEFDEYSVVLRGALYVRTRSGERVVKPGQTVIAAKGEWVQYSTPEPGGAEYVAVCLPAFTPGLVHRDE